MNHKLHYFPRLMIHINHKQSRILRFLTKKIQGRELSQLMLVLLAIIENDEKIKSPV